MKKNEFLEWFDNQKLNLNGYNVIVSNQLISKENTSPIVINCEYIESIWKISKQGPDDRTGGNSQLVYESNSEDTIFDNLKQYLEDMDYVNNYYKN